MNNHTTKLYIVTDALLAILSMLFPVTLFFLTGEIQYSITRYLRITEVAPTFYFYSIIISLLIFIKFVLKYKVIDFIYVVIFFVALFQQLNLICLCILVLCDCIVFLLLFFLL